MAEQNLALTMHCDAGPLRLFIDLFHRALKDSGRLLGLGTLPDELARAEFGVDTGSPGQTMTLYPSDGFMRFAAAALAGHGAQNVVENAGQAQPERATSNLCPPSDVVM